jgi:chromosome segregation ATPase
VHVLNDDVTADQKQKANSSEGAAHVSRGAMHLSTEEKVSYDLTAAGPAEILELRKRVKGLEAERDDLKSSLKEKTTESNDRQGQVESLEKTKDVLERDLTAKTTELDNRVAELGEMAKKLNEQHILNAAMESQLKETEVQLNRAKEQEKLSAEKVRVTEGKLSKSNDELVAIKTALATATSRQEAAKSQLKETEGKLSKSNDDVAKFAIELKAARAESEQMSEVTQEVQRLREQTQSFRSNLEHCEEKLRSSASGGDRAMVIDNVEASRRDEPLSSPSKTHIEHGKETEKLGTSA